MTHFPLIGYVGLFGIGCLVFMFVVGLRAILKDKNE